MNSNPCVLSALVVVAALAGMVPAPVVWAGKDRDVDPFSVVQIALSSSGMGLAFASIAALDKRDYPACVAIEVLKPAFAAAADLVGTRGARVPGLKADIRSCLSFRVDLPKAQLEDRVAELIDSLVGSTMATVESAVGAAGGLACKDQEILRGVLRYLRGLTSVVLDELATPDGTVAIPATAVSTGHCEEGATAAAVPAPPREAAAKAAEAQPQSSGEGREAKPENDQSGPASAIDTTAGVETALPAPSVPPTPGSPAPVEPDIVTRLQKLRVLLDQGLITTADYEKRKAEILAEL